MHDAGQRKILRLEAVHGILFTSLMSLCLVLPEMREFPGSVLHQYRHASLCTDHAFQLNVGVWHGLTF